MKHISALVLVLFVPTLAWSQAAAPPTAAALRVESPPSIDGRLDDEAWARTTPITDFTQRDPSEGEPVSEATEVRVVYDDEALYIGARLYDRSPPTSRLGRRDMQTGASDWLRVSLDSYRDRRTAFRFEVNPAGVRRDATITGAFSSGFGGGGGGGGGGSNTFTGGEGDLAWDAVWDARTTVDTEGWTAEMRIPFSQLRFAPADEQTWGFQLERIIARRQEIAMFSFSPRSEQGGVAFFGDLTGLRGIRPGRPLELVPYALSQGRFVDPGVNPFREDREVEMNAGLDARYRLTSNLTLSATVNPDFGQVELDPAVVNLTAFETRFDEKRPFFVEGSNSFEFGGDLRFTAAEAANLLYSRRVGRAPQLGVAGPADVPRATRILGAGKLTGKTANGWSLGLMNAVTGREEGRYLDSQGVARSAEVEPLTSYFAGRVNRELRAGQSAVGVMFTSVNRDLHGEAATMLRSNAYSGGLDFSHEFWNRDWVVGGFLTGSRVEGTPESILRTQRASTRYFQRPDAETLELDPTATSLGGYAASVQVRKDSGEHWTGDWWASTVSPGYEVNDLGFQRRADRHATAGGIRYTEREPGRFLRTWNLFLAGETHANYDGDVVEKVVYLSAAAQHLNYWRLSLGSQIRPERMDDRFTRGGPLARQPSGFSASARLTSDPRRRLGGTLSLEREETDSGSDGWGAAATLDVRTSPRWNLSVGPEFTRATRDAQYVTAVPDPLMTATHGARYVFAPLEQRELSLVTRLNYTFTPDLTLELYAQPLLAHGEYGTPKEFRTPAEYEFDTYGEEIGTLVRNGDRYTIDPDGPGPARFFSLNDRSFTTRSLRGNAVLRWEYRPGSTFYLVWQQERLNPDLMQDFQVDRALGTLFDGQAKNVLVLKWSYWMNP